MRALCWLGRPCAARKPPQELVACGGELIEWQPKGLSRSLQVVCSERPAGRSPLPPKSRLWNVQNWQGALAWWAPTVQCALAPNCAAPRTSSLEKRPYQRKARKGIPILGGLLPRAQVCQRVRVGAALSERIPRIQGQKSARKEKRNMIMARNSRSMYLGSCLPGLGPGRGSRSMAMVAA